MGRRECTPRSPGLLDLHRRTATGVTLELKLVTATAKVWLCTKGHAQCGEGIAAAFVVGRAARESLVPDPESGICDIMDYGPEDVTICQRSRL